MSFFAAIDDAKLKTIWSKSITSMASLADHVKFVISPKWLSMSVFNNSKTSHAEVVFKKDVFVKYQTDFTGDMLEGYEEGVAEEDWEDCADSDLPTYSFLVNAKHLSTLFKNLNANELNYICLKVYFTEDGPVNLKYKLLVEVKTEKLIVKKFQANFQPVFRNSLKIAEAYKECLYQQEHTNERDWNEFVRHIVIENTILKEFLEVAPSSAEELKVEVKEGKILFTAHTPPIFKDKEYLKQPMRVTMAMSSDELINCNLSAGKELVNKSINFRLKDFKIFISLISSINSLRNLNYPEDGYVSLGSSTFNAFEILFKSSGDPVLFKIENDPNIIIHFVQITSEDSNKDSNDSKVGDTREKKLKLEIPSYEKQQIEIKSVKKPQRKNTPSVKEKYQQKLREYLEPSQPKYPKGKLKPSDNPPRSVQSFSSDTTINNSNDSSNYPTSDQAIDHITYGDSGSLDIITNEIFSSNASALNASTRDKKMDANVLLPMDSRKLIINENDTDYSELEEGDYTLGPTQMDGKPKSLLD